MTLQTIPVVWPGLVVFAVALFVIFCVSVVDWIVVSRVVVPLDAWLVVVFTAVVLELDSSVLEVVSEAEVTWVVFWYVADGVADDVDDDVAEVDDDVTEVDDDDDDDVVRARGATVLGFIAGDVAKLELKYEAVVVVTGFELGSEDVVVSATSQNKSVKTVELTKG